MTILPIGNGDRARPHAANQFDDLARVLLRGPDRAVGQREILAPRRAQHRARRLGLPDALIRSAVARHLAARQIAQPDRVTERRMLGERAAEPNLQIVGMRAERQQIEPRVIHVSA